MMKVITGERFKTSFGVMLVHNEQSETISVGEQIRFDNAVYEVKAVIPPANHNGKWALKIE